MIVVVAMAESHISDPLTADLRTLVQTHEPSRLPWLIEGAVRHLGSCLLDTSVVEYDGLLPTLGGPEVRGKVLWRVRGSARLLPVYVRAERFVL